MKTTVPAMDFEPVIGLEVHAQLKTDTKIFCDCSTAFGATPNTHTCPVCTGMPGSLPVLNRKAVDFALKMAAAADCVIAGVSRFARKNYFYPDLPKGYQISQYELPVAGHGRIVIATPAGEKEIRLTRIHLEEDAGKLIHDNDRAVSYVDFNRTGVPLIEIVSEPDLRSPEEAGAYLRELRLILRYLEISDGNMEEGSFRCDANISVRRRGETAFGPRTELKNLNSFRHVEQALAYEIKRQINLIRESGSVIQETLLWDSGKMISLPMRGKEEAQDYRYFPDPDLVPLAVDEKWLKKIREHLPELPREKRLRLMTAYELPFADAEALTSSSALANYFEACAAAAGNARQAANWVMVELLGLLNARNQTIEKPPVSADHLGALVRLINEGVISGKIAKTVFEKMAGTGLAPEAIINREGLVQMTDRSAIATVVEEVMAENPGEVEKYRAGKTRVAGFLAGQVMKKTGGRANPQTVNALLAEKLAGE